MRTSWNKGKPWSEETKKKFSLAHKGKSCDESTKLKMSKSHSGANHYLYGKHLTGEAKDRMKEVGKLGALKRWAGHVKIKNYNHDNKRQNLWRKQNKSKFLFYKRRREIRQRGAEGNHTIEQWENLKRLYGYMCLCCKRNEPEIKLTQDHIIPLSKGGTDYIDNIQPLCVSCNSRKSVNTISYLPPSISLIYGEKGLVN